MIESIVKICRGIFRVQGDTDNTLIGNTNDSLKTMIEVRHDKQKTLSLLLEQSRFLRPANFDSITTVYTGNNLALNYYEDTHLIAKAELTYTSETNWGVAVEHYLLDNDGTILTEDDDSNLLLE